MNIESVKISTVKSNPNNPRVIKDDKFDKLVQSIKDFPQMLEIRPIVVNDDMIVLGGNMRLKACKEAGLKEVPIIKASDLTEEQQREFIIKDNVGFGEWDWEQLKEWDGEELEAWGLDVPKDKTLDTDGLFDIEIPFYTASDEKPNEIELADTSRSDELIKKIDSLDLDTRLKNILKIRAAFFTDFNFQKIADYYHNSDKNIKELFEDLGMVILTPRKALEKGFVDISENIMEL
jgi:hypothetical protein